MNPVISVGSHDKAGGGRKVLDVVAYGYQAKGKINDIANRLTMTSRSENIETRIYNHHCLVKQSFLLASAKTQDKALVLIRMPATFIRQGRAKKCPIVLSIVNLVIMP